MLKETTDSNFDEDYGSMFEEDDNFPRRTTQKPDLAQKIEKQETWTFDEKTLNRPKTRPQEPFLKRIATLEKRAFALE